MNRIQIHFRLLAKDRDKKRKFQCDKCKRCFKTRQCYNSHIKREHFRKTRSYKCVICKGSFRTSYKFKKHFEKVHHMKDSIEIQGAIKKEKHEDTAHHYTLEEWNEIVASKSKECPVCHKLYFDAFKMRRHLQGVHSSYFNEELLSIIHSRRKYTKIEDTGDFTYEEWKAIVASKSNECPVCHKTYADPFQMLRHVREVHSSEKKYMCDVCGKLFTSTQRANQHKKSIHLGIKREEENFECDICKKIMRSKLAISDHMSIHTGEKLHQCKLCNKCFGFSSDISRHMKRHKLLDGEPNSIKLFECELCNKTFLESNHLNRHLDSKHGDDSGKYDLCKICGKSYKYLKKHMLTHSDENNVKICCHICGKYIRRSLRKHMLTHTGEKPYACDVCGSSFRSAWNLRRHMRKHDEEK